MRFSVATGVKRYGFASSRRLKTPAEFSALLRAPRDRSIRAERQMLSINAAWVTTASRAEDVNKAGSVRFGVTVGKRNARRSVDRVLVKRIVREACRHHADAFERCAAQASARIDIALRLKTPLVDARGHRMAMRAWRRQVRVDADSLLHEVLSRVAGRLTTGSTTMDSTTKGPSN
ncbi:MAG TPA: ribonuclease P protein component [Burkholderiaceae bacterium]|nr:ribonuclease P protein component [Burkholderiaceae bacterium]